jgi:hypothetical protein
MAEESTKELQCIDWRRCFAFLEIVRSFRMAIHPGKVFLCFVGLALTFGAACLVDQIPGVGETDVRVQSVNPDRFELARLGIPIGGRSSFYENVNYVVTKTLWGNWAMPYVDGKGWGDFVAFLASPLAAARDSLSLAVAYWDQAPWFALINTVLALAIWAVVGGAVSRMSAVRFAREESVPLKKALGFALVKWPSTVMSPLIPFGVLVLVAIGIGAPTGLALMVPYVGEYAIGIFFFVTLIIGLLMALVIVGGTFSLGLQWPTIAAEGSDSFDAISRSISYVSSRPWRYLFYVAFSAVYGCLVFVFVKLLTFIVLWITHHAVATFSWGVGGAADKLVRLWAAPTLANPWPQPGVAPDAMAGGEASAAYLFMFWVWVAMGMMIAFLPSFFFTSQTVVYFLLRKVVDATDMEEVYVEETEEEQLPLEAKPAAPDAAKVTEPAPPKPPESPPATKA